MSKRGWIDGHHDGPSWTPSSHTWCNFFCWSLHYPQWQVWRIITGTTFRRGSPFQNTLISWNMGTGITSLNFMTYLQDGPSQSRRTFVVSVTSHLDKILEYGYWDYFSELHDEPAGRTVTVTTDRRGLCNPTLSQTSPSSFSSCTMLQFIENIMSCCDLT